MAQFDVYKYDLIWQVGLVKASTAFYYAQNEDDTSDGRSIAITLATILETTLWTDYLKGLLSNETVLTETRCQLYAPTKDTPDLQSGINSFGDVVGNRLASANAQIITKYPGFWSRSFICRNFIPGAAESDYTGDRITNAAQVAWEALADVQELLTVAIVSPEALTFDQVCFSATRWKNFDPLTQSITEVYSQVNSINVRAVLGTQRARIPPRNSGPAP